MRILLNQPIYLMKTIIHIIEHRLCSNIKLQKHFFSKGYTPNSSEEVFVIKKVKNTVLWTHEDLNVEEIVGRFYKKELQKTNQEDFRIVKVIKKKGDKLFVKWKGYNNLFNNWIDKKDILV